MFAFILLKLFTEFKMYACVIYTCEKLKKIIPINWIYEKEALIKKRKHYLAFYHKDVEKFAPPSHGLQKNIGKDAKLKENCIHTIWLENITGR